MFFVVFLACQEQSALQGVGYGLDSPEEGVIIPSSSENQDIDTSGFEFLPEELEVSIEVNNYRLEMELPPMTLVEEFSLLARQHSQAMADGKVDLGHDGFRQRYHMASSVASLHAGAENVGMNFSVDDPVGLAVSSWLSSDDHLRNIEGKYQLTGVGVAISESGATYFTQLFLSGELLQ